MAHPKYRILYISWKLPGMIHRLTPILILIALSSASCDPAYSVILSNQSGKDRTVTAVYPDAFRKHLADTLGIVDNRIKVTRRQPSDYGNIGLISKDTTQHTYSFVIPADKNVYIEGASFAAYPTWGQIFIIDGKDSVHLVKGNKQFKRTWFIGGNWTYTIH